MHRAIGSGQYRSSAQNKEGSVEVKRCKHKVCCLAIIVCIWLVGSRNNVYATDWSFTPGITVGEEYDSNVLFSARNVKSDFITQIEPKFVVSGKGETTQLNINSRTLVERYAEDSSLDTVKNYTNLYITHDWTERFSTGLIAGFTRDTTLESQLEEAGIATRRVERYRYNYGLKQRYAFSETFSLSAMESGNYTHYPDDLFPDAVMWQLNLNPVWAVSARDSIGLNSSYFYSDYLNTSTIQTLQGLVYWERALTETSRVSLGAGYRFTWFDHYVYVVGPTLAVDKVKNSTTNDGFVFLGEWRKQWSERFSTTFTAGRDQYNTVDARSFQRLYLLNTLKYRFSELITLRCGLRYDHDSELEPGNETINYVNVSPAAEFKLTRSLSLRFRGSYAYDLTDTDSSDSTAQRYRCWLELYWEWPRFWNNS